MNFRQTQAEGHPQCGRGQAGIQDLSQAPTADRSGENIHDGGQKDKASAEPDIRNVADPDLFRMGYIQAFHQIWITRVGVCAVRGQHFLRFTGRSRSFWRMIRWMCL
jgi:hypothetical protein